MQPSTLRSGINHLLMQATATAAEKHFAIVAWQECEWGDVSAMPH